MPFEFFSNKGNFFKGNLHGHSNYSDGKLTPEDVCNAYIEKGYDFISITDHFLKMFNYPITSPELKIKNLQLYLELSYIQARWKMENFGICSLWV